MEVVLAVLAIDPVRCGERSVCGGAEGPGHAVVEPVLHDRLPTCFVAFADGPYDAADVRGARTSVVAVALEHHLPVGHSRGEVVRARAGRVVDRMERGLG